MVIFALSAVVLFAIAGLAVDAGLSYLTSNSTERAASAAALAGVPYMPDCFTASSDCPYDATDTALDTAARNGLQNNAIIDGHQVTVTVSRYPAGCTDSCEANKLTVSVSAWVPATFMRVLGFGDHQVTATETAYYLPELSLGEPGATLGATVDQLMSNTGYYFLRTEGWNTSRSEGDAYTPNPSDPNATGQAGDDVHALSEADQGTDIGQSTSMPSGFNALPNRGGYNYEIDLQLDDTASSISVYNPAFAPDPCTSSGNTCYHEDDSSDQSDYSVMEYTLFKVNNIYNHLQDTVLAQAVVDPIDATSCPTVSGTNLNAQPTCGSAADARGGSDSSAHLTATQFSDIYHTWVSIFAPPSALTSGTLKPVTVTYANSFSATSYLTAGDTYRLRVDTLDASGHVPSGNAASGQTGAHKGYAIQVLNGGSACGDCTVGGIDDLAVYTPITLGKDQTSGSFEIPLVDISPEYGGLTVNFYLYDPGDLNAGFNANDLSIIDPETGLPAVPDTDAGQQAVPIYNLHQSRDSASGTWYQIPPNNGDGSGQRPTSGTINGTPVPTLGNDANVNTTWCNTLSLSGNAYGTDGGQSTNSCYNGEWLLFQITIPSEYAHYPGTNGYYWDLEYSVTGVAGSSSNDTFTMVASFNGTPIHLLP
ncbi:MAG: hypothetical protein ACLQT7_10975 [Candidatus Dormibacteria bacterium]